jgi:hypothetical protein
MDKITLEYPVPFEGGELKEISIRRPKVSDIVAARKSKKDEAEQEITMISKLTDIPPETIETLDLADYKKIQEALSGFFG